MCASDVHFDVPQALLVDVLRWSSGSKSKRIRFFLDREQCQVPSALGNTTHTIVVSRRGCQHGRCGAHMCEQRAHSACGVRGALLMCVLMCHRRFWWRMCCGRMCCGGRLGRSRSGSIFLDREQCRVPSAPKLLCIRFAPTDTNLLATPTPSADPFSWIASSAKF